MTQRDDEILPIRAHDPYAGYENHPYIDLGVFPCDTVPACCGWEPGRELMQCNCCHKEFFGSDRALFCADCVYAIDVEDVAREVNEMRAAPRLHEQ